MQPAFSGSQPSRPADVALEAGELLRDLHNSRARSQRQTLAAAKPSHQLAAAERSTKLVTALLPTLGGRVQALLHELEAEMPSIDDFVPTHGDFNARQLLVTPDGLAAVDLDGIRLAPAALDPTTYAAHLVFGGPDDLDEANEVLEQLLAGYGERPPGLGWYLATCILRHSRAPFRYPDEHWPERIEAMVTAAEAALDRYD